MPRNGSSVYSLPAGNPVVPGTTISTTWANTTLTDIATALTQSLSTDGSTAAVSLSGKTLSGGTYSGPSVTGVLTLTGGQVEFPAVQVPSANANTLDDYEEGTWTPTISFDTPGNLVVAYTTQVGKYTKIGRQVSVSCRVVTSTFTHTTAAGALRVSGLPFTSEATGLGHYWSGCNGSMGGLTGFSSDNVPSSIMVPSSTNIFYVTTNLNTGIVVSVTTAFAPTAVQKDLAPSVVYNV